MPLPHHTTVPALPVALGTGAGIVFSVMANISVIWIICVALAIVAAGIWLRSRICFLCSAGLVLGAVCGATSLPQAPADFLPEGRVGTFCGTVEASVEKGRYQRATVSLAPGLSADISFDALQPMLTPGDSIRFRTRLAPVEMDGDLFGPDISTAMIHGSSLCGYVAADSLVITGHRANSLKDFFPRLNLSARERIYNSPLSSGASALLASAWLGNDSVLTSDTRDHLRAMGLAHMLCVSGFHVALVAFLIDLILFPMRLAGPRGRWRYVIATLGVWFFGLFIGLTPSVLRACIAITIFHLSLLLQRLPVPLNTVCIAFITVLVINPLWLFMPGLLLSFGAVSGIILMARPLNLMPRHPHWLYRLGQAVSVCVAATLGALPVTLYLFGRIPLLFIPANIIGGILFPVFMICGAIAVTFPGLGAAVAGTDNLYRLMDYVWRAAAASADNMLAINGVDLPAAVSLGAAIVAFAVLINSSRDIQRYVSAAVMLGAVALTVCFDTHDTPLEIHATCLEGKIREIVFINGSTAGVVTSRPIRPARLEALRQQLDGYLRRRGIPSDNLHPYTRNILCGSMRITPRAVTVDGDTILDFDHACIPSHRRSVRLYVSR